MIKFRKIPSVLDFDIPDDIYMKEKSLVKTRLPPLNSGIKVLIKSFREPYAISRFVQCEIEIKVSKSTFVIN